MKLLLAIAFTVLVSSCSSWKKPPSPPPFVLVDEKPKSLTTEQKRNLRSPETLKKYAIGRYVDPSNGLVMHEAHDVYRVEATSKWNRRPLRAKSRIDDPNPRSLALHHEAELNQFRQSLRRERASAKAAMAATETMQTQIKPLAKAVENAKALAEQNAILRQKLRAQNQPISTPTLTTESPPAEPETNVKDRLRSLFESPKTEPNKTN